MLSFRPFGCIEGGFLGRTPSPSDQIHFKPEASIQLNQVHGDGILLLDSPQALSGISGQEGDGMLCLISGTTIAIRTADCVPILLAHPGGLIGAIHAGWRGTQKGILHKALKLIAEDLQLPLSELSMAIGPAICGACYEVGNEVFHSFKQAGLDNFITEGKNGRLLLNLIEANRYQATRLGVKPENIDCSASCTYCESEKYFSYRAAYNRNEANIGRNYSWIRRNPG